LLYGTAPVNDISHYAHNITCRHAQQNSFCSKDAKCLAWYAEV